MHRTASILGVTTLLLLLSLGSVAADGGCEYDDSGDLDCSASGTTPGTPGGPRPDPDRTGPRYVYTATDAVIGDCHYWSNVPGGLDAWDPADDADPFRTSAGRNRDR